MTAPARARTPRAPRGQQEHIHLPSVHIRGAGGAGYDYEEDLFVRGRHVHRVIRFAAIERGIEVLVRETRDELCPEELAQLQEDLPVLMDEGNPAATAMMKECAAKEFQRQLRITSGAEQACASCGCSETRACSKGCVWATQALCSRCIS